MYSSADVSEDAVSLIAKATDVFLKNIMEEALAVHAPHAQTGNLRHDFNSPLVC